MVLVDNAGTVAAFHQNDGRSQWQSKVGTSVNSRTGTNAVVDNEGRLVVVTGDAINVRPMFVCCNTSA